MHRGCKALYDGALADGSHYREYSGSANYPRRSLAADDRTAKQRNIVRSRVKVAKWSRDEFERCASDAERGDMSAQLRLGITYLEAKYSQKDSASGRNWLRKAAGQGSKEAMYRLALDLLSVRDFEGLALLNAPLLSDFPPALYELGNYYHAGGVVRKDERKAVEKWSDAANRGHIPARINLLKYQLRFVPLAEKPLYILRMIAAVGEATVIIVSRGEDDPRVMGSMR